MTMENYTHIATNKKTGEVVKVVYDKEAKEYRQNFMVAIIPEFWDIKPLTLGM